MANFYQQQKINSGANGFVVAAITFFQLSRLKPATSIIRLRLPQPWQFAGKCLAMKNIACVQRNLPLSLCSILHKTT